LRRPLFKKYFPAFKEVFEVSVLEFGVNLVFDGLQLFAHYEIEVEFAFHLFLVWKLGEEKV
jgi:hypothetical protein